MKSTFALKLVSYMKSVSKFTKIVILFISLIVSSCGVQKRVYLRGLYVPSHSFVKNHGKIKSRKTIDTKVDNSNVILTTSNPTIKTSNYKNSTQFLDIQPAHVEIVPKVQESKSFRAKNEKEYKKRKRNSNAKIRNSKELKQHALAEQDSDDIKLKSKRKDAIIKGVAIILMALLAGISVPALGTVTAIIGFSAILLLDILISIGIIRYYRDKKEKLAKTTGLLRLLYAAVFSIGISYLWLGNLAMFNKFWSLGLITFGFHLIALGLLFNNEGGKKWVNYLIKSLLIIAGIGYIFLNVGLLFVPNPVAFTALVQAIFIAPQILGEILFALWMIIKGGKKA